MNAIARLPHPLAPLQAWGPFDVVVADPPWMHYGAPGKWGAAGKHYGLMEDAEIRALPVADLLVKPAVLFLWATSSTMQRAIATLAAWGLHYRGVEFVWVKTSASGLPVGAQGVRPSIVKPTTEFVLSGSTERRGRPLPLADEGVGQVVFAPRGAHSEKPEEVQDRIERLYPRANRAELFARRHRRGWACWGDEAPL